MNSRSKAWTSAIAVVAILSVPATCLVVRTVEADEPLPESTPDVLPRPDFHFSGEVGRTYLESDKAQFPQPVEAPEGAPNILLVLIDVARFGQFGRLR